MLKSSPNIDSSKVGPLEKIQVTGNNEIFINYVHTWEILDQNKIFINDAFALKVAFGIIKRDDKIEPQTIEECRYRNDWSMWKEAIQTKLNSNAKREVFGLVVHTAKGVMSIGYKWVFIRTKWE